jgi:hypothetical protein
MLVTDTAGDSLQGAIDGINRVFKSSLAMNLGTVSVFYNGRNKVAVLEDGFTTVDAYTIALKEPPLPGDTVQVSYETGSGSSFGGQFGGVPNSLGIIAPYALSVSFEDLIPPRLSIVNLPSVPSPGVVFLSPPKIDIYRI